MVATYTVTGIIGKQICAQHNIYLCVCIWYKSNISREKKSCQNSNTENLIDYLETVIKIFTKYYDSLWSRYYWNFFGQKDILWFEMKIAVR